MQTDFIYVDHAATSPVHPQVLAKMLPYFYENFGNPSSIHRFGQSARQTIDRARQQISRELGCQARDIVFTSGGTESNNLAIQGICADPKDKHIITSQIEHHAVLHVCQQLERQGAQVTYLPVNHLGQVSVEDCRQAIRANTVLISIMYGNNEVGSIQPINEIGNLARSAGIPFHVDGAQILGNIHLQLSRLPIDLFSCSAHKIQGPKGVGALYVHPAMKLQALMFGGSQERMRRAGTENVPAVVGFAEALSIANARVTDKQIFLQSLRQLFIDQLTLTIGRDAFIQNGHPTETLMHILNISFPGIPSATMLMNLDLEGVAASSGSACTAGSLETSHVLRAMQIPIENQQSAIRFSFSFDNNRQQMMKIVKKVETIYKRLRKT
jgi:cysteine desulfurase